MRESDGAVVTGGDEEAARVAFQLELLTTLHDVLEQTADFVTETSERYEWNPVPGSPADAEIRSAQTGPGGPWGEEPVQTALSYASLATWTVCDHLNTMATLIEPSEGLTLFGLQVMSRSALEAASQAWWLLEPDIGERVRVERSFGVRLRSARDTLRVLGELGVPASDIAASEQRKNEVLRQAAARGIAVHRRNGQPVGLKSSVPAKGELVAAILEEIDFGIGKGFYSFLAGISHADPWALHQFFNFDQPTVGSVVVDGRPSMNFAMVFDLVFLTVLPALSAGDRLIALYGWGHDAWNEFARDVKTKLVEVDPRSRTVPM